MTPEEVLGGDIVVSGSKQLLKLNEMQGKTISQVMIAEGPKRPRCQVFLLFTDGTFFEIYSDEEIKGTSIDVGGIDEVRSHAANPFGG